MDRKTAVDKTEKKILIIDPDGNDRKIISHFLRNSGYLVETGKDLTDALKKIGDTPIECVIMDVDLGQIKGYEAVSIIKNIDPDLKIIMTTKKNTKRLEAKVREQDIFFYFIKSFGKEELELAINDAFKK
jgi:two-component system phosphate regulon sensor histidine kinase PhoR